MDEEELDQAPGGGQGPRAIGAVLLGGAGILAALALARRWGRKGPQASLRECALAKCYEVLPTPTSIFGRPDPRWDAAMGGVLAPERWGYYGEGAGTTCGVFAAWILSLCGAPAVMVNRGAPEGSGFAIGAHITKIYQGAKQLGWLRLPPASGELDLLPGDLYCTTRAGATYHGQPVSGEHVGYILSLGAPGPDGTRAVETADGGQTDQNGKQCAKRRARTLRGRQLSLVTGPATIDWWVRLGGDK